ncbi:C5AR1 protein, partial [Alcedo cyanopectus]|nr:C5AR1 protein [Ceyx cyanopectus]
DLDGHHVPLAYRAILALYALIFLLGVLGNGAVIWVTALELRRTVNGIWFLNLAMADLLCCLALPFLATPLLADHHWPLGGFACKLLPSLTVLNMFASVLLLTFISADRCALVTRPVWCHNHRSVAAARGACAVAWLLAALLTFPSFLFRAARADPLSSKVTCVLSYEGLGAGRRRLAELLTASARFLGGFLLPGAVIAACHGLLLARLRSKGLSRSPRAARLILAVIVSFFVCWLPYHVVGLVLAAGHPSSRAFKAAAEADPLVAGIAYVNSCINPLIYVILGRGFQQKFHRSWRAALKKVLSDEVTAAGESRGKTRSTLDNDG